MFYSFTYILTPGQNSCLYFSPYYMLTRIMTLSLSSYFKFQVNRDLCQTHFRPCRLSQSIKEIKHTHDVRELLNLVGKVYKGANPYTPECALSVLKDTQCTRRKAPLLTLISAKHLKKKEAASQTESGKRPVFLDETLLLIELPSRLF